MEIRSLRKPPEQDLVYSFGPVADEFELAFATIVPPQALLGQRAYSRPAARSVPFGRPVELSSRGSS